MTIVRLGCSFGNIDIKLHEDKAPETCKNFISYVSSGHYIGCVFHRVIPNFMIQTGGMDEKMQEKQTKNPIKNEADNGLKNDIGFVSMARTNEPHSATSQFFINTNNNDFLNFKSKNDAEYGYAVFGEVVAGLEVVKKIDKSPTKTIGMHADVPVEPVLITSCEVLK